jgi:hypothetical protein
MSLMSGRRRVNRVLRKKGEGRVVVNETTLSLVFVVPILGLP